MGSRVSVLKEEDAARLKSQLQDLGILICFTEVQKPRIEELQHFDVRNLMMAWYLFFSTKDFRKLALLLPNAFGKRRSWCSVPRLICFMRHHMP